MASRGFTLLLGLFLLSFNTPAYEALTCSTAFLPLRPLLQFAWYIVDEFILLLMKGYPALCQQIVSTDFFDSPQYTGDKIDSDYSQYQLDHRLTIDELRYYNWFAAAAYCNYRVSNKYPLNCCFCNHFSRPIIYKKVYYNFTRNTKVLVTLHSAKKEAVFSFRGTQVQNEVQVLLDFRFDWQYLSFPSWGSVPHKVGIHRGFYDCTDSLFHYVLAEMYRIRLNYPDYRIVLVGHSLGAAMASISMLRVAQQATLDFLNKNNTLNSGEFVLVTYGQPRIGDSIYADLMNGFGITVQRVVNKADIVTHFVRVDIFGTEYVYLHHGQEVWIQDADSDEAQIKYCSRETYEDTTCSSMTLAPKYTVSDHIFILGVDYSVCLFLEDAGLGVLPLNLYGTMLNALQKPKLRAITEEEQEVGKCGRGNYGIVTDPDISPVHDQRHFMKEARPTETLPYPQ